MNVKKYELIQAQTCLHCREIERIDVEEKKKKKKKEKYCVILSQISQEPSDERRSANSKQI